MNAKYYDLNIWSQAPNELCLTAYEWELAPNGELQTNNNKWHTISFIGIDHLKEIEFLMNDLWVNSYPLTDHDEWKDLDELYNSNTPTAIRQFLESLPFYEVPAIALTERENA
jgi:hypothetical protein